MPCELIAGNDVLNTTVRTVDSKVEGDDGIASKDIGFDESG